ncbi:MAG: hypothetical protein RI897_1290 [Verrucomicrobiota bacterium]|jgi:uncharacterized protein (DUF362 family)
MPSVVRCYTNASARLGQLVEDRLQTDCGHLRPNRIVIKPNWVLHETQADFPINALVTDPKIIQATVEACLKLFPDAHSILIADCPLQWADWPLMCQQSGLQPFMESLTSNSKVQFHDLRREVFTKTAQGFLKPIQVPHGDPAGYRQVSLGNHSHLEPLADQSRKFAVNDYNSTVTSSNHSPGNHNYLVSQSILDADLLINLPKWKTHQKGGITIALKNLVGINGDKSFLPHFRRGAPSWGGDEYPDEHRWLYYCQTTLRDYTQKRSPLLFNLLKPGWEVLKRLRGIETRYTAPQLSDRKFYAAGGAWFGNDTLWRMIYDLNLVAQCTSRTGQLHPRPQRDYYCIVDGLTSGEGNGPLQPLPRQTDWLVFGSDPFAIDTTLTHCMGFDIDHIPSVSQRQAYLGPHWGRFDKHSLQVALDETLTTLDILDVNFHFTPPPGWRNHIER